MIEEILKNRDFWRDEAKRCYKEIEELEAVVDQLVQQRDHYKNQFLEVQDKLIKEMTDDVGKLNK